MNAKLILDKARLDLKAEGIESTVSTGADGDLLADENTLEWTTKNGVLLALTFFTESEQGVFLIAKNGKTQSISLNETKFRKLAKNTVSLTSRY